MTSFNETHGVSSVVKWGLVATDLPTDPKEIDLRFVRMITLCDTFDGEDRPSDGSWYRAVFYGNRLAWESDRFYHGGSCEFRTSSGDQMWRSAYHGAMLFLKIQRIARRIYFGEDLSDGKDTIFVSLEDLRFIEHHPQYQEMVEDFGVKLLDADKISSFRVEASKRYSPEK